jgi:hypothetical protein
MQAVNEQKISKDINASLDKSVAKMHELLLINFPYPSGMVESPQSDQVTYDALTTLFLKLQHS